MLTRAIRRSMQRQEGQALVIGALAVLILCIAVLTTVNLGHTVNERVRLQNTSDAAAYSMAAMEARAFNFYSFANRTQVSHYVTAMLWQSLLSFTYWAEAFLVDVYGVMKTLNVCAGSPSFPWSLLCNTVIPLIPYLGAVIRVLTTIMNLYRTFLASVVLPTIRGVNPDRFVGKFVIPAYRVMNELLAAGSVATLAATLKHVVGASQDVIVANDPNISALAQRSVSGILSACILDRSHMVEANGSITSPRNPFTPLNVRAISDGDKIARAKRAMAGVANATRFACDNPGSNCGPGWVTSRKPLDLIQLPGSLGVVRDLLSMLPDWKWGQTKLLSYTLSRGKRPTSSNDRRGGNFIRGWKDPPNAPQGMLAQGDAMGSDDLYQIKLGPASIGPLKNPLSCSDSDDPNKCWGDPAKGRWDNGGRDEPFRAMMETSIWAMSSDEVRGGIHWRLVYPVGGSFYPREANWNDRPIRYPFPNNFEARIGLSQAKRTIALFVSVDVWVANTRLVYDTNHPWEGLTAFPHFEPGQYSRACPGGSPDPDQAATRRDQPGGFQDDFNQPSSFVILNKTAPEMDNLGDPTGAGNVKPAMLNTQKALNFEFAAPSKMVFDNTRTTFLGGKGLNTVARAQTYYHRPGNWHEQPNFFNPYWRPRLASVWQGHTQFPFASDIANALPGPARNQLQRFVTH